MPGRPVRGRRTAAAVWRCRRGRHRQTTHGRHAPRARRAPGRLRHGGSAEKLPRGQHRSGPCLARRAEVRVAQGPLARRSDKEARPQQSAKAHVYPRLHGR